MSQVILSFAICGPGRKGAAGHEVDIVDFDMSGFPESAGIVDIKQVSTSSETVTTVSPALIDQIVVYKVC